MSFFLKVINHIHSRFGQCIAVTSLLGFFWLVCIYSIINKSLTVDEPIHLTAGASYWAWNDYRLQPENGNLPQRIAAIPLILSGEPQPNPNTTAWLNGKIWTVSADYLFKRLTNAEFLFFQGRVLISLCIATIGGITIFVWSRKLWGLAGGYLSLILFCFSPNFIANSRLMTSDALFASVFTGCVYLLWKLINELKVKNLLIAGIVLGITCVTKFSAVYALPVVLILLTARQLRSRLYKKGPNPKARSQGAMQFWYRLTAQCAALFTVALIAVFVIWAFYGFRYAGFAPEYPEGQYALNWDALLKKDSLIEESISLCKDFKLIPEAFLYGFSFVYNKSQERTAYFLGEYGMDGWFLFFPFTFISKTPLSTLFILLLILLGGCFKLTRSLMNKRTSAFKRAYNLFPVLVPILVIATFSVTSNLNIGHRHILPIYPFIFILCGGLLHAFSALNNRIMFLLIGTLIAYNIWTTIASFPNYIPYFNPLIGGPKNAHHYVLDSSLDWGQDLPQLKIWLDANNKENLPYYLAYFGTDNPNYHGLFPRYLHSFRHPGSIMEIPIIEPGYYCLSISILQGLYVNLRKPFSEAHYNVWQYSYFRMRSLWSNINNHFELENILKAQEILEWRMDAVMFQQLRVELLRNVLLTRQPEARIGYSIHVFRLDERDIQNIFGFRTEGFPEDYPYSKFFAKHLSLEATGIEYQEFNSWLQNQREQDSQ